MEETDLFRVAKMSSKRILDLLHILDTRLGDIGSRINMQIYGGTVMCLVHGNRDLTEDIDACYTNYSVVDTLVDGMSVEFDLPKDWLNDTISSVKDALLKETNLDYVGFDNIILSYPDSRQMLAMKLFAGRLSPKSDLEDALYLCSVLGITAIDEMTDILREYICNEFISERHYNFMRRLHNVIIRQSTTNDKV